MANRDLIVKIETPENVKRVAEAAKKVRIALEELKEALDEMNVEE